MECFNHHGQQSVAICKICNKGLCHNCCRFGTTGYVCSDVCAQEESKHVQITNWSYKYVGAGQKGSIMSRQYAFISLSLCLFGIAILAPGTYDYFVYHTPFYPPLLLMGFALLIGAFLAYRVKPR